MTDWISVRDRLPEAHAHVLACRKPNFQGRNSWAEVLYFDGQYFRTSESDTSTVTHWLPIPDLPKAEPRLPFSYKCEGTWGPWAVFHVTRGRICHFSERMQAETACDTLNKMWQIEQKDQSSESKIPRCPQCDIALSFIVVNEPITSHKYWECPRCGKETEIRGKCKDCNLWGWYDEGSVRNCHYHQKFTEDTDSCDKFATKGKGQ